MRTKVNLFLILFKVLKLARYSRLKGHPGDYNYDITLADMPETPRLLSLGMNGILSKLRQVEPGEAEQIPT